MVAQGRVHPGPVAPEPSRHLRETEAGRDGLHLAVRIGPVAGKQEDGWPHDPVDGDRLLDVGPQQIELTPVPGPFLRQVAVGLEAHV